MGDAATLGAAGAAPLSASEWQDAKRAVALARRTGAAAVSVRHVTLHLNTLELAGLQAFGHGNHAAAPESRRGGGGRGACHRPSRSRGRTTRDPPSAALAASLSPLHSPSAVAATCESADASPPRPPAGLRRTRAWLRSAAFHFRRSVALRHAFRMLCKSEASSVVQCDVTMQCDVATTPLPAARPCAPCGSPCTGSANLSEGMGAGVRPRGVKRAASSPSPSVSSHDADVPTATHLPSLLAPPSSACARRRRPHPDRMPGAAGRFEVWLRQQPQDRWHALIHRRYQLRFDDLPPSSV